MLSVCASLISHISDKISPWVGCRVSLLRSRYYLFLLLAGSNRAFPVSIEQVCAFSQCQSQGRAIYFRSPSRLKAINETSQQMWVSPASSLFLDQHKPMVGQLAMYHALNGCFCLTLFAFVCVFREWDQIVIHNSGVFLYWMLLEGCHSE